MFHERVLSSLRDLFPRHNTWTVQLLHSPKLVTTRVLIFQIKLRTQNYCNYSFLSLFYHNFASQKLRYDQIGPQTTLD